MSDGTRPAEERLTNFACVARSSHDGLVRSLLKGKLREPPHRFLRGLDPHRHPVPRAAASTTTRWPRWSGDWPRTASPASSSARRRARRRCCPTTSASRVLGTVKASTVAAADHGRLGHDGRRGAAPHRRRDAPRARGLHGDAAAVPAAVAGRAARRSSRTIADASPAPLVVYDIPARTGVRLELDTLLALAAHPNIVGAEGLRRPRRADRGADRRRPAAGAVRQRQRMVLDALPRRRRRDRGERARAHRPVRRVRRGARARRSRRRGARCGASSSR